MTREAGTITMLYDVCSLDDLEHGQIRAVQVNGRTVGLVRWDDEVFALRMTCPHQLASLTAGVVRPRLSCEGFLAPVEADTGRPVLTCPWHGWEFDVRSGRPTWNSTGPGLKTYPVSISARLVRVEIAASEEISGATP
jgi:3-phenylpropionate/trans-cinnamate dioxygenase ferredoxin subunit